ncbi:MAG: PAS domain-containing protein [bacterium]|nr:PAS domain-containing protein [bacterium]
MPTNSPLTVRGRLGIYTPATVALAIGAGLSMMAVQSPSRGSWATVAGLLGLVFSVVLCAYLVHAGRRAQRFEELVEESAAAQRAADAASLALHASEARLSSVLESVPEVVWSMELPTHRVTYVSPGVLAIHGLQPEAILANPALWFDCVHPDDRAMVRAALVGIGKHERTTTEYRVLRADGTERWVRDRAVLIHDESGAPERIDGIMSDATDEIGAVLALEQSERRYRLLVENASVCIKEIDVDGCILSMNPAGLKMLSVQNEGQVRHARFVDFIDEVDRSTVRRALDGALAGTSTAFEFGMQVRGDQRHYSSTVIPVRDDDGTIERLMGVTRDTTDQVQAEERKAALRHELDHRVKNTLGMVLALADQAMVRSPSVQTFHENFRGRLLALARNHETLAASNWRGVEVVDTLRTTFAPFDSSRFTLDGPDLRVPARVSGPLSLALHELTTNAAKYGALSEPDGRVSIHWKCEAEQLAIYWRESTRVPVEAPRRFGMGLTLVRGLIEHELGGSVHVDFRKKGLHAVLVLSTGETADPEPPEEVSDRSRLAARLPAAGA